jgi:hypothetical protein
LAQSDYIIGKSAESIKVIKYGLKEEIFMNTIRMPRSRLKNMQIADVMNYISSSRGNKREEIFTVGSMANILKN